MARNEEKAQSMLNRWLRAKEGVLDDKRPRMASSVNSIPECEKWRLQIVREIIRKVSDIQNSTLPENRVRDLNDEINRLFREKSHWERRIRELGGPNYASIAMQLTEDEGRIIPGQRGTYRYFGVARNLPEVKALFERAAEHRKQIEKAQKQRTAPELHRLVDATYYGYTGDPEEIAKLEQLEAEAEKRSIEAATERWRQAYASDPATQRMMDTDEKFEEFGADPVVPTNEEIQQFLFERQQRASEH